MEEFVSYLVKNIVDCPDAVDVQSQMDGDELVLTLKVASQDLGKVIGRKGRSIGAIRVLTGILGVRHGIRVRVVVEDETSQSAAKES